MHWFSPYLAPRRSYGSRGWWMGSHHRARTPSLSRWLCWIPCGHLVVYTYDGSKTKSVNHQSHINKAYAKIYRWGWRIKWILEVTMKYSRAIFVQMDGFSIKNKAAIGDSVGYSSNHSSKGRRTVLMNTYSPWLQFKTRYKPGSKNIKLALSGIAAAALRLVFCYIWMPQLSWCIFWIHTTAVRKNREDLWHYHVFCKGVIPQDDIS